jgi:integrase
MSKQHRGSGYVFQPKYRDKKTGEIKVQAVWWIQYSRNGKRMREPSGCTDERGALKLLRLRQGELAIGKPTGPDINRTTFEDLAVMVVDNYKMNEFSSLDRLEDSINHLREFFADYRAIEITSDRITAYIAFRQSQNAANATVNNELAALSKMLTLGERAGKVGAKPYIPKLKTNNARKGFFEQSELEAVLPHLPEYLRPAIRVAYITGWRVHDEILTREKKHVDLQAGWLRLEPGESKNDEGREFPITEELREVLRDQLEYTARLQKAEGRVIPWLFHNEGKPILNFRKAWLSAMVKAGLGTEVRDAHGKLVKKIAGKIPHDFRRTAVRNLERAGVSRSAAMRMVGHKTESIYRRYAIVDAKMLQEAGAKLSAFKTGTGK